MKQTLEVVTFNLRHGTDIAGQPSLGEQSRVLEGADIVLLQELDCGTDRSRGAHQLDELATMTGMEHRAFGANLSYQGGWYGTGLLSRLPILEMRNVHVPAIAEGPTDAIDGKVRTVAERRGVLLVTLASPLGQDAEPILVGVHHASLWRSERLVGSAMLTSAGLGHTGPVILGGDRSPTETEELALLVANFDHYPPAATTPPTYPSDVPTQHIDHVFGRGFEHVSTDVVAGTSSDHRAVKVSLNLCN